MPAPPDRRYEHRFHAGNVGDVWKHIALVALMDRLGPGPRLGLDTHGGAGWYPLGPTGEWTEGIGQLRARRGQDVPRAVSRYLELIDAAAARMPGAEWRATGREGAYPGSPLFLAALLGAEDRVLAFEIDPDTARTLETVTAEDARVAVRNGDGVAHLADVLARESQGTREQIVFADPPYADRREWELVPDALLAAHRRTPSARIVLWYPVKSLARPNAMLGRLEKAKAHAVAIELITSSLASKKNRLNGSGLVLFAPDPGLVAELCAVASWLGPRLAVQGGYFNVRLTGFGSTGSPG